MWYYEPELRVIRETLFRDDEHQLSVEFYDGIPHLVVRGVVPAGYDNVDYEEWYPLELVEQLIRDSRNANQDRN